MPSPSMSKLHALHRRLPSSEMTGERNTHPVEREAQRIVSNHPNFRGRDTTIRVRYDAGRLILTGRLPSFYLKQLLQEAVRSMDGVKAIDNRVDVISSRGLSG